MIAWNFALEIWNVEHVVVASVLMLRSTTGHFRADLMQLRHISAAVSAIISEVRPIDHPCVT